MPSFSVKYEENIVTITDRSFKAFSINERELDIFNKNLMTMFFRPTVEKPNRIKYTAPYSITFDKYIQNRMNEHKLYSFIARITEVMSVVEKYDFLGSNLILDEKLIFIDELTDKIYMLYRPLNNRIAGGNVYGFLDNLILKVKKLNGELADACDDLHVFLSDANHYKVSEIVEYLKRVYPSIYREMKLPEMESQSTRLDTIMEIQENEGTTCLTTSAKTETIADNSTDNIRSLVRLVARDKSVIIDVNKDSYIIGKSREKADGVITGNSMISRVHAEILYCDDKFFIKDLGSANGTYVDGNKLIDDRQVQLSLNSIIRLADQEFTLEDVCGALSEGKVTKKVTICDLDVTTKGELIAFEVAKRLSEEDKKVLFVSTDFLQSYGYFIGRNISMKSEQVTALKVDLVNSFFNSMNSVVHDGKLDLYPVFPGPLWTFNINIDFYIGLVNDASNRRIYDYIIVDCREVSGLTGMSGQSDSAILVINDSKYADYLSGIVLDNTSKNINIVKCNETKEGVKDICRIL